MVYRASTRGGKGRARVVKPANYTGAGDSVEHILNSNKITKGGLYKKTTEDLCDFCLPEIKTVRIMKKFMYLRGKGFKFACVKHFLEMKEKHGSMKGRKVLCDYRLNIKKL